ncbi:MAG: hypothetical protein EHM16_13595 [Betaproteobacteria bacterium]|nr:MAG: hypothetical protein EHM16_13595 [Betaproteobacteria bacterium]
MTEKPDPEKIKGPGGLNMRELHELVKKSHARDEGGRAPNQRQQPQNRWQRLVRYVWDKKRG